MSEIQSIEGRPLKKGLSPGQRSAYGALGLLVAALALVLVGQVVQPPTIPPDHVLALIERDGHVVLAKSDGSAVTPFVGAGVPVDPMWVLWAPGGDFLTLRTADAVVVVDRAGVVSWRKAVAGASVSVAWSPDGSAVAIFDAGGGVDATGAARASLQIQSSTGALQWDVPLADGFGLVPGYGSLAWSPDGSSLAFTGFTKAQSVGGLQPTTLWIATVATQALAPVTHESNAFIYGAGWASDRNLYVARSSFEETGIWRVDASSGALTLVARRQTDSCAPGATCTFELLGPIVPSPDGGALAFRDVNRDLSVLTVATGAVASIPAVAIASSTPYAWSADGSTLLYLDNGDPPADPAVAQRLMRFDPAAGSSEAVVNGVRAFDLVVGPS
ncbi:MAG TPA: hypothetical protein VHR16_07375 [Candidatus Limnocylindrales bacterium]|nr:hypothetical protein [Candidatus Limnocylindrales bacterium]